MAAVIEGRRCEGWARATWWARVRSRPKGFSSFDQLAQVCVSAEQVIDELSTKSLIPANQLAAGFRMAVRKGRHRIVHHLQHSQGRRPHGLVVAFPDDRRKLSPHPSSCREMQVYSATYGHLCPDGPTALETHRANWGLPGN